MKSRENILSQIKLYKPNKVDLQQVERFDGEVTVEHFKNMLVSIGGKVIMLEKFDSLENAIALNFPFCIRIASNFLKGANEITTQTDNSVLQTIDLALVQGEFGVAENGAIWLTEEKMLHRTLPIITQHLAILLDRNNIVLNMHRAYQAISKIPDYGVFIAGPSKTADIEQSLVIGAHGARSMTVILI